jgi:hypothetical protein
MTRKSVKSVRLSEKSRFILEALSKEEGVSEGHLIENLLRAEVSRFDGLSSKEISLLKEALAEYGFDSNNEKSTKDLMMKMRYTILETIENHKKRREQGLLGSLYFHLSNSGVTFEVNDNDPKYGSLNLTIDSGCFGQTFGNMVLTFTPEDLKYLGKFLIEMSEHKTEWEEDPHCSLRFSSGVVKEGDSFRKLRSEDILEKCDDGVSGPDEGYFCVYDNDHMVRDARTHGLEIDSTKLSHLDEFLYWGQVRKAKGQERYFLSSTILWKYPEIIPGILEDYKDEIPDIEFEKSGKEEPLDSSPYKKASIGPLKMS